jgi:hypothetical protein
VGALRVAMPVIEDNFPQFNGVEIILGWKNHKLDSFDKVPSSIKVNKNNIDMSIDVPFRMRVNKDCSCKDFIYGQIIVKIRTQITAVTKNYNFVARSSFTIEKISL